MHFHDIGDFSKHQFRLETFKAALVRVVPYFYLDILVVFIKPVYGTLRFTGYRIQRGIS